MENETTGDQFSEEVEDRLQNLFGEEEPSEALETKSTAIKPHPLRDLKTVILSIDEFCRAGRRIAGYIPE